LVLQDLLTFGLQLTDLSLGRSPDGSTNWTLNLPTPNTSNQAQPLGNPAKFKVNEWMANPATGNPWFELYNADTLPVSLSGLYLTDDLANPTNHPIGALSFIGAGDFVEMLADGAVDKGADHTAFRLQPQGGALGVFAPDGSARDWVFYGAQARGVSTGRLPDGSDCIYPLGLAASPGRSNLVDSDQDGLPDAWEILHSLNPYNPADAAEDSDSDGLNNLVEYQAGTDPQMSSSSLQLTAAVIENGDNKTIVLQFMTAPGRSYTIESCDILNAYPWRKLADIQAQPGPRSIVIQDDAGNVTDTRFYRLVTPQAE
jgi:Bacterial TSP3 repeat